MKPTWFSSPESSGACGGNCCINLLHFTLALGNICTVFFCFDLALICWRIRWIWVKPPKQRHFGLLADLAQKLCWLNTRPGSTTVFFNGFLSSGNMMFCGLQSFKAYHRRGNLCTSLSSLYYCTNFDLHVNPWQTPPSADAAIPDSNHFWGQATRSFGKQPHHLHSSRRCTCAWANWIQLIQSPSPIAPRTRFANVCWTCKPKKLRSRINKKEQMFLDSQQYRKNLAYNKKPPKVEWTCWDIGLRKKEKQHINHFISKIPVISIIIHQNHTWAVFFWWCGVYTLAEHAYAMPRR